MIARQLALAVMLAAASPALGIYPDDHWDYSTKLTMDNYKDVIQSTIDDGKTLMAPGWNAAVRAYKDNGDVEFADVNLSEDKVREGADGTNFSPGAGGWPTVRYFNKETGVGGAPYVKKTSKTMCDELKEEEYMFAYVEEAAGTSKCSVSTKDGCGDQEVEYIDKWMTKSSEEKQSQLERIGGMLDAKVTPDAKAWLLKRKAILKQFLAESNPDEL